MTHIVVLGGGFAGVATALSLERLLRGHRRDDVSVLLVDQHDFHTFNGALYEVATAVLPDHAPEGCLGMLKKSDCIPHATIFSGKHRIIPIRGTILSVDRKRRTVTLDENRTIEYDWLVVALGSVTDYFGIPGLKEHSFGLKDVRDAIAIRCHVEDVFHDAQHRPDAVGRGALRFVIGGGGFSGCEFAGELLNYCTVLARQHRLPMKWVEVRIIEAKPTVLFGLPERVVSIVTKRLAQLGVTVSLGRTIKRADAGSVTLDDGEVIPTQTLVWTGGVRANPFAAAFGLPVDPKGRLTVDEHLRSTGDERVFAAGDVAAILDQKTKRPLPGLATLAVEEAAVVAQNVLNAMHDRPLASFTAVYKGYVIPVRGKYAVAVLPHRIFTGFVGWVLRRLADLRYFLTILPPTKALHIWWDATRTFVRND